MRDPYHNSKIVKGKCPEDNQVHMRIKMTENRWLCHHAEGRQHVYEDTKN